MSQTKEYFYGPVPSRRLGRSLGLDIFPFKTCSLDCIYCQLGPTSEKTIQRKSYIPVRKITQELKKIITPGLKADYITISGSGEPALNADLGKIIKNIKSITKIPLAVITNSTLMYRRDVRMDCALADLLLPSLDAGDEDTFRKINRPHRNISIKKLINGLSAFREQFSGPIWLEVFLIEGVNTSSEQLEKIKQAVKKIRPDKIQLNTAVRPAPLQNIKPLSHEKLRNIAEMLGPNAEGIADFEALHEKKYTLTTQQNILAMLKRRPCSIMDIASALTGSPAQVSKTLAEMQKKGLLIKTLSNGITFFKIAPNSTNPHT